jgi:rhodanese-related sulfurtransferase
MFRTFLAVACFSLIIVSVTFGTILATPLRYSQIIEPRSRDISPAEAYAAMQSNDRPYMFIDVRSQAEYDDLHAMNSSNTPIHLLYDQRKILPKKGIDIYLICSGGRLAGVAYGYLEHYGFNNLYRIDGGVKAWATADLPIEGKNISR